jgi:TPR repeat protein
MLDGLRPGRLVAPAFFMITITLQMKALVAAAFLLVPDDAAKLDPALKPGFEAFQAGKFDVAARIFTSEARSGKEAAQFALGILYQEGKGVERSIDTAISWYQKGAEQGHSPSCYNLALLLLEDPSMLAKGAQWMLRAAEEGSEMAQLAMGDLYIEGRGVARNVREGIQWIRKAHEAGLAEATFKLGILSERGVEQEANSKMALAFFEQAAKAEYLPAMLYLGAKWRSGQGGPPDYAKAREWYRKAAVDYHSGAGQLGIGEMCEQGLGAKANPEEALKWYRQAAESGETLAWNKLGFFYEKGIGVEADASKALECYTKAAEAGLTIAMFNLSVFYGKGIGVAMNDATAVEWLRNAASGELAVAQNEMGLRYLSGRGVLRDPVAASAWFQRAAEQGFENAYVNLALMYQEGIGVRRNLSAAVDLMARGAGVGNIFAQIKLAEMVFRGWGADAEPVKAYAILLGVGKRTDLEPKLRDLASSLASEVKSRLSEKEIAEAEALSKEGFKLGRAESPAVEKSAGG